MEEAVESALLTDKQLKKAKKFCFDFFQSYLFFIRYWDEQRTGAMVRLPTIDATFCIVTPMFLGDARQESAFIRPASVKGALAFWWRALNFSRFVREKGSVNGGYSELLENEIKLFGGPGCQGRFALKVIHNDLITIPKGGVLAANGLQRNSSQEELGVGARYLGYGVVNAFHIKADESRGRSEKKAGELERSCIAPNQEFSIKVLFHPGVNDDQVSQICAALKLFGLLGGLGARVRRGYGSVSLKSLKVTNASMPEWHMPTNVSEFTTHLQEILHSCADLTQPGSDFNITAFANESRCWVADQVLPANMAGQPNRDLRTNGALWSCGTEALDYLGRALLNYRGWGGRGSNVVGGQRVQQQFVEDHDWYKTSANDVDVPYRSAFGLPHMYNSKNGYGVTVDTQDRDRRASPMMLHIVKGGDKAFGIVTLFPTRFSDAPLVTRRSIGGIQRNYDLTNCYGSRNAAGKDVLLDFVGFGPNKFQQNQVLSFQEVGLVK